MKMKIQKAGHSLDPTIRSSKLVPAERETNLESLVEQMTDENRHDEIETGNPVGHEVW